MKFNNIRNSTRACVLLAWVCLWTESCVQEAEAGSGIVPCSGVPGEICTVMGDGTAGLGEDGVTPLLVSLYLPQDMTVGPDGKLYVLDWNNHRVRTIEEGVVKTIIGTGELGDAPEGPALKASFNHPTHIAFAPDGTLILSAWHNSKIMAYDSATKKIKLLVGNGERSYGGDDGPAKDAILDLPVATAFDDQGRMLIMDQANQRIRRIESDGIIHTVVGPDKDFLPEPEGYARVCDSDNVCKLCLPVLADDPECPAQKPQGFAGDGGPGTEALIYQPYSQSAPPAGRMEMGPDDILYFCDTGNHRVRAFYPDGHVETVAGSAPKTFDRTFPGDYGGDGHKATKALLNRPTDVAIDSEGRLFIADTGNSCVRMVDTDGVMSTVAGRCGKRGDTGDGGPATQALINRPYGVALDEDGNLFIADTHNHRIRMVPSPVAATTK